jgi:hypothetical protein
VLSANFVGTYANKVLTQTTPAEIVIDGVTLALADRVLLIGQTDKTQNGIYTVTTLGVTSGAAGVCTWFNLLTSESFEALELTVDQHEKIAEMIETDPYVLVDGKFAEASSLDERLNALYAKYTEK